MHEKPLGQRLLRMALDHAGGRRITDIHVEVGELSGVVPSVVVLFFDSLSQGTLAEGACLHFEPVVIQLVCVDCGGQVDTSEWQETVAQVALVRALQRGCPCGSKRLRVTEGATCRLVGIEVEDVPPNA